MRPTILLPLALALLGAAGAAAPQSAPATGPLTPPEAGEELTVYLMTMGPGPAVWERFVHNAIWIRDSLRGTDVAYNYGMFSFEQENFLLRFVQGRMNYWMEGFDAMSMANAYIRQGRSVWAQELNLTPAQRAELRDFLEWNARPENRFYLYDYYVDNCSTRVRDAVDRVLGGDIRRQTEGVGTGTTFRSHTRRLTAEDPLLYTGLMLGLGQPVDREISVWEEMFLPMRLRDTFGSLSVTDASGESAPLVRAEEAIFLSPTETEQPAAPGRGLAYLFVGGVVGLALVVSAWYALRRRDAAGVFTALAVGWCVIGGLFGLVLAGLWLFTDHAAAYRNENLFLVNPLLLGLAVLIPLAGRRADRYARPALLTAAAVAAAALLGTLLGVLPAFEQDNLELTALVLPIDLALAAGVWLLYRAAGVRGRAAVGGEPKYAGAPGA